MIKNEDLNKIVELCKESGYDVTVRDISYNLLCRFFDDKRVAYKIAFGTQGYIEEDVNNYNKEQKVEFLKTYMDANYPSMLGGRKSGKNVGDISFDENKAEIIKLLQETKKKEESGELDAKQSLDLQTKLRIALNDKFGAKEEIRDNLVCVNIKFNSFCECGREIYIPTKEDLMKKYNLKEQ